MKQFSMGLAAFVIALGGVFGFAGSVAAADQYVNQADITVINTMFEKVDSLSTTLDDTNATMEDIDADLSATKQALQQVATHSYSTDLGERYLDEAATLKAEATEMVAVLDRGMEAMMDTDEVYGAWIDDYNAGLDAINQQVTLLNEAVDESNNSTGNMYLYVLIGTVAVAIGAFIWAFARPDKHPEAKAAQRKVAYASLAPLAGAGFTYYSFASSSDGGYTILYGPAIFGVIIMIGAVANYLRVKKDDTASVEPPTVK